MESFMVIKPDNTITEYAPQRPFRLKRFLCERKRVHWCGTCEDDEKELGTTSYDICNNKDLDELKELLKGEKIVVEQTASTITRDPKRTYHLIFVHA